MILVRSSTEVKPLWLQGVKNENCYNILLKYSGYYSDKDVRSSRGKMQKTAKRLFIVFSLGFLVAGTFWGFYLLTPPENRAKIQALGDLGKQQ